MAFLLAQCNYCKRHRPVTELEYGLDDYGVREMSCRDIRGCDLFMDDGPGEVLTDRIEARITYGICFALVVIVMFALMQVRF